MSHLRCWSLVRHSGMVLCWCERALDGPIDASNYKAVAEEFQMVLEGNHKVLGSTARLVHNRDWSTLAYWFLTLYTTLKML
jgi:hypothetical protein